MYITNVTSIERRKSGAGCAHSLTVGLASTCFAKLVIQICHSAVFTDSQRAKTMTIKSINCLWRPHDNSRHIILTVQSESKFSV